MTCKDCICHFMCSNSLTDDYIGNMFEKSVEEKCLYFKDKSTIIEKLCEIGDTVYVITKCEDIIMSHDDNYFTGTGAIECPFEDDCEYEDCDDNNIRIFKTKIESFHYNENGLCFECKNLFGYFYVSQFNKIVFLTKEEAEKHWRS